MIKTEIILFTQLQTPTVIKYSNRTIQLA